MDKHLYLCSNIEVGKVASDNGTAVVRAHSLSCGLTFVSTGIRVHCRLCMLLFMYAVSRSAQSFVRTGIRMALFVHVAVRVRCCLCVVLFVHAAIRADFCSCVMPSVCAAAHACRTFHGQGHRWRRACGGAKKATPQDSRRLIPERMARYGAQFLRQHAGGEIEGGGQTAGASNGQRVRSQENQRGVLTATALVRMRIAMITHLEH